MEWLLEFPAENGKGLRNFAGSPKESHCFGIRILAAAGVLFDHGIGMSIGGMF